MTGESVSDVVAAKVKDLRHSYGWSTDELAARCAEIGYPEISQNVIENIESGRRRNGERTRSVTVDELFALAKALQCVPAYLLPGQLQPGSFLLPMDEQKAEQLAHALLSFVSHHRQLREEAGSA